MADDAGVVDYLVTLRVEFNGAGKPP